LTKLVELIKPFGAISLEEMDHVKLLNRVDSKFIFNTSTLHHCLQNLYGEYRILEINDKRYSDYQSLYYDSVNFDLYKSHQNGKLNRYKVRFRKYDENGPCYLEIKLKSNRGRTIKERKKVPLIEKVLSENSIEYIQKNSEIRVDLEAKVWSFFKRITLVGIHYKERLTLDFELAFGAGNKIESLSNIAIAELKQDNYNRNSPFAQMMKSSFVRPKSMSKYCIGSILIHKEIKQNNFKELLLKINKIEHELIK
jgi:VTC domain